MQLMNRDLVGCCLVLLWGFCLSLQVKADPPSVIINDKVSSLKLDYSVEQTSVFRLGVKQQSEIIIEGVNHDTEPRIVILRFDDAQSYGYGSRVNIERVVIPGPFKIQQPLFGLKTSYGRLFDWQSWQRLIIFQDKEERELTVGSIVISEEANFSERSFGFDLGTSTSPVMSGMTQITKGYAGLTGEHISERHFSSGTALTADGIEGIESLVLPVPNGTYDVTLWLTMEGQWENLPRQLEQQVLVQGQLAFFRNWEVLDWLQKHYMMSVNKEAWLEGSPWDLFGDNPYKRATTIAQVTDGYLKIKMNGRTTHDNYLAGVFVTPTELAGADSQLLYQALQSRFEQKWQVVNLPKSRKPVATQSESKPAPSASLTEVLFDRRWQPELPLIPQDQPHVVTKGSFVVLDFAALGGATTQPVTAKLSLTDEAGRPLSISHQMRYGIWRYQRPLGSSTLLSLSADELRVVDGEIQLNDRLPRRINLLLPISSDFPHQKIIGKLALYEADQVLAASEFTVQVLDLELPKLRQNVGIYHEKPVHWGWFGAFNTYADINLACDYQFMEQLGMVVLSPPLSTPQPIYTDTSDEQLRDGLQQYLADLNLYHQYFSVPAVDYTTVKRFQQYYRYKPELQQRHLNGLISAIKEQQLPIPQFAIADEVKALNGAQLSEFSQAVGQLQNAMPDAQLLGQLNKPQNLQLAPMMDTLLINHGFGVDAQRIAMLQRQGKSVWMYNMPHKRLAAGFYLWQSKAQGYLQWHGRMPTGQPYNPVDGREADFQMFYPSVQSCDAVLHINAELLAIAEGVLDRRWLNWLIKQARENTKAQQVLSKLRQQIPSDWQDVEALDQQLVHQWRQRITNLARELVQ